MDYLLTIQVSINAVDDIEAREKAMQCRRNVLFRCEEVSTDGVPPKFKLQQIEKNKPPRKVEL